MINAADRFNLLLPWLNGDFYEWQAPPGRPREGKLVPNHARARQAVAAFLKSFDGSADAGFYQVVIEEPWTPEDLSDEALAKLKTKLTLVLDSGFGDPEFADYEFPAKSLWFAVKSAGRPKPDWRTSVDGKLVLDGGAKALREYRAAGAYRIQVTGDPVELAPFLMAHLLTLPGMIAIHRCERPGCGNYVLRAPRRGAVQRFCSAACREETRALKQKGRIR